MIVAQRAEGALPFGDPDQLFFVILHGTVLGVKRLSHASRAIRPQDAAELFARRGDLAARAAEHGGGRLVVRAGMTRGVQAIERHVAVVRGDQRVRRFGAYQLFFLFVGHGCFSP